MRVNVPPLALSLTVSTSCVVPVTPCVVVETEAGLEMSRPSAMWSVAPTLTVRLPLPPAPMIAFAMAPSPPLPNTELRLRSKGREIWMLAPRSKLKSISPLE